MYLCNLSLYTVYLPGELKYLEILGFKKCNGQESKVFVSAFVYAESTQAPIPW